MLSIALAKFSLQSEGQEALNLLQIDFETNDSTDGASLVFFHSLSPGLSFSKARGTISNLRF